MKMKLECVTVWSYTNNGTANKCSDKFADGEMSTVVEQALSEEKNQGVYIVETAVMATETRR